MLPDRKMLIFLTNVILLFFGFLGILLLGGWLWYKLDNTVTTVDGGIRQILRSFKEIFSKVFWFCMGELGHPNPATIINQSLWLTNDELNELKHLFGEKIFEIPILEGYSQAEGCQFISFSAVNVKEKYLDLEYEQLVRLIEHTVQSFYLDIRQQKPFVKVPIASPKYFQFVIPLSGQGLEYLDAQEKLRNTLTDSSNTEVEPLEEVFQIFDDEDER